MKKLFLVMSLLVISILALVGCAQPKAPSNLILTGDMVRGSEAPKGPVCVLNSQYQRGESVVFRASVIDPETGKALPADPGELLARATPPTMEELIAMVDGITVVAHLSDGQSFPMHFGPHPPPQAGPPADYFWSVSWVIPEDYPTGTIDSWVTADWPAESKAGRWDPFNVFPAKLTVVE